MTTLSTRPAEAATPTQRIVGVATLIAAVTAAIVLTGTANRPTPTRAAVALTSADPIDIAQGISITPAPGWTLGNRGPDWVALGNADTSAQMRVAVKPAGGTDIVAVLQGDMNQYTSSSGLSNLQELERALYETAARRQLPAGSLHRLHRRRANTAGRNSRPRYIQ